jgi:hypothetical protein
MNQLIASALENWVPYKLSSREERTCRWLYLADKKITEPFFDETISRCLSLPENSGMMRCVSSVDILPEWSQQVECISPSAIIFHISRCGSTLISQLLALQSNNIVLSEVPFFDELLRDGNRKNDMKSALPILKAAIALYGAKRKPGTNRLFIKADSWHIHFYKELRELYPAIPFILLYRRPDEVLRSQQKKRGMHAAPGVIEPTLFGFDNSIVTELSLDEYMARVIETYLQAFMEVIAHDQHAHLVNYDEGGLPIVKMIAGLTNTAISETELRAMEERSGFHAKSPGDVFNEPETKELPCPFLEQSFKLYEALEKIRLKNNVTAHP